MNTALILLGGNGKRFSNELPKQFYKLDGQYLCYYTIKAFNDCSLIDEIVLVIDEAYEVTYAEIIQDHYFNKVKLMVSGGSSRQESAYKGLLAINGFMKEDDNVLIHDGARPFVTTDIIENNIKALDNYKGVITAIPSEDTVMFSKDGTVDSYSNRNETFRVQTPQSFKYGVILCAHQKYAGEIFTDDAQLLIKENIKVGIVNGSKRLLKVTTKEDIKYIREYTDEQL